MENGKFRLVGARGQTLGAKTEIVLLLPPAPGLRDEGAIAAAIEIVVVRNTILSAALSRFGRGQPPTVSAERAGPGELYLKIHKPASVNGHRQDFPADAFAASPMRSAAYPQFAAPSKR